MKTFSVEMEICRQRRSHDLAWLVELEWDDEVGRYGSRPVTIGGLEYRPLVAALKGLRLALPAAVPEAGTEDRSVQLELINTLEEGSDRFELQAESQGLEGRTVRVGFVFLDPAVTLQAADIVWVQTYQVEMSTFETARAVLQLRESPAVTGRRWIGRTLSPRLDPDVSSSACGRMIPLVFGRIERAPLLPFRVGRRSFLRQPLLPEDRVIAVEDVSVFPESGSVQIGDEVIGYAALDPVAHTLGRGDSPVARAAPAWHRSGSAVDSIPAGGFQYLVADHPCRAVGPVYAGARQVDPAHYAVTTEVLGGRTVQKVVFAALPADAAYAPEVQTLRLDGRDAGNFWGTGAGNAAENPLSAVDGGGQTTAAVLTASHTPLEIEYGGDLGAGASAHGVLRRCRLGVEFSASARWSVAGEVTVELGRGEAWQSSALTRPPLSESSVAFPAHAHTDSIRDQIADTRELFEIAEQSLPADFDETLPPAGGWIDRDRALDGNLGTWAQNTAAGGPPETAPLNFRLRRSPLGTSEAAALLALEFHVRLSTDETAPVAALIEAKLGSLRAESIQVQPDATPRTFSCAMAGGDLRIEDLMASHDFAVRSVNGRQLKVHGAWLCLKYRPRIAGRAQAAAQQRSGTVEPAEAVAVALPTQSYRQEFDVTGFVEAHGGWAFFAPQNGALPCVRVHFGSADDPAAVRVSALDFTLEYLPRTGAEVQERFDAAVEGIEQDGRLLENPADLIEWLVTGEAGLGWAAGTLDAESFAQARAWLEGRGWKLSRRLGVRTRIDALLDGLARESACRLWWEAGRLRLRPMPTVLLASESAAALDETVILSPALARRGAPLRETANVVRVAYGAGYDLGGAERRYRGVEWVEEAEAVFGPAGRREREYRLAWLASGSPSLAASLAALWLGQLARPPRLLDLTLPLSQSRLERGDVVTVHHPASRLLESLGEIVAIEFVDGRHVRATVALQPAALYCWYGDAANYIVQPASQAAKVFVVEGTRAAVLDRAGRLFLRGEVVEQSLPAHPLSEAIEYDPDQRRVHFGVAVPGGGYAAVFALDADGRLLLRGTLREAADLSALAPDSCHSSDAARFMFSCDLETAVLSYEAAADRLDLPGAVVEHSPLF